MLYPWREFSCSWTVPWASVWDGVSTRVLAISSLGQHVRQAIIFSILFFYNHLNG
jgi:hypothetical protein